MTRSMPTRHRSEADAQAIARALDRLLGSASLRSAPQLQRLLRHLVQASMNGDVRALKAYTIGVDVLGRGADFDPNVDPVVRLETGRLRSKLLQHYSADGANDRLRFEIPKGGYAVNVVFAGEADAAPAARHDGVDPPDGVPAADGPVAEHPMGRDADLAAVAKLMASHRLVTIVGAGGVGKTRLALAAAARHGPAPEHGRWWIDLAPLSDPEALPLTIASAARLHLGGGQAMEALLRALQGRQMLLVLDNCEHLVADVGPIVAAIMRAAPGVRLLATSQQALHLANERPYRLDPLPVPPVGLPLDKARGYAAVQLLLDRAHRADPHLRLDDAGLAGAVAISRCCDGIPLALEMAAARLPWLGAQALLEGLERQPALLRNAHGDAPARQHTLQSALDWSHSLLDETEKAMLRRLSVFAGAMSLDAGLDVGSGHDLDRDGALEALLSLLDKSLLHLERDATLGEGDVASVAPRYRLLFATRRYAARRLADSADATIALDSHGRAMRRAAERASQGFWQRPLADWLREHLPEHADLQLAFDHALARDDAAAAAAIGETLLKLELSRGQSLAARRRGEAARRLLVACADDALAQARLWSCASVWNGRETPAQRLQAAEQRVAAWRRAGNPYETYWSLARLVAQLTRTGQVAHATQRLQDMERLEDPSWPARVRLFRLQALAHACHHAGDGEGLEATSRRMRDLGMQAALPPVEAFATQGLAAAALLRGDAMAAQALALQAQETWQALGRPVELGQALVLRCHALLAGGQADEARAAAAQALPLLVDDDTAGDVYHVAAHWACRNGRDEEAALLLGCALAWRDSLDLVGTPDGRAVADRVRSDLDRRLGEARLERLLQRGRGLAPASAEQLARRVLEQ